MVFKDKVTNLGTLVMKVDLDLVVTMVLFVESSEFNISLSKMVVLAEVHVADFDVHVVVNCWELPVVLGIIAPVGFVTTILFDGGEVFLAIMSELHVNSGVHLVTNVTSVDFEVCLNDVDSNKWHWKDI